MEKQVSMVRVDEENPSILKIQDRCIKCGMCATVCSEYVSVHNKYDYNKTQKPICVNCGQCVKTCPVDALVVKNEYKKVKEVLKDKSKVVIVSTSPSVRVALGEAFGMPFGTFVEDKMVGVLKQLGFSYVLDTNFSADLTICEEANELVKRIQNGGKLPQFTSCCPSWIKFAELFYPEILPNISTCKRPIGMQGPVIKTYFAKKKGIDPSSIVNVALTPCVAKKMEIRRKEFNSASKFNGLSEAQDMDYCITCTELAEWIKEEGIDFNNVEGAKFDNLLGSASGAGVIFGNSGGVMEAAVRTAYNYLTGKNPSDLLLKFNPVRGLDGIKEAEVEVGGIKLRLCAIYGLQNARTVLEQLKDGVKTYDFIEIMTCPGGCIGGGGQPKQRDHEVDAQKARIKSLYKRDDELSVRSSHENKEVIDLYREFLGERGGEIAEKLLHTVYFDKSKELDVTKEVKQKMVKYRCTICGEVFELPEGQEPVCPVCFVGKDLLEVIG